MSNYRKQITKEKIDIKKKYKIRARVLIFTLPQTKLDANWHKGYTISKSISDDAYIAKNNNKEIRGDKRHIRGNG